MIVKLMSTGGYVVGDGECPFNPDEFYMMFADKMIEAMRQGLTDFEIPEEEIEEYIALKKREIQAEVVGADAKVMETVEELFNAIVPQ